jgi:hypothetical protein
MSYSWQGEEGDGEDGEAGGHDLAHPGAGHCIPIPDSRHRDLGQRRQLIMSSQH